jgi:hypothetical protein
MYLPTRRRLMGLFFVLFGMFVVGVILTAELPPPR